MSSNRLPPGLLNRNGTPVSGNKRLPSLKNSPGIPPTALSQSVTKGGVAKRQFKPNITTQRSTNSGDSTNDKNSNGSKEKVKREPKSKDKKRNQNRKELVQLDAAVFNGISNPVSSNRSSGESVRSSYSFTSKKNFDVKKFDVEIKKEPNYEKSLYKDDFIDHSDEEVEEEKPKNWEMFHNKKSEKTVLENRWFLGENAADKLYLFQLPDMLLNKPEGKIGKLRFYKSGRVEIVDEESGLKFDVFKGQGIKEEKSNSEAKNAKGVIQEVVSISGEQLTCFGAINEFDVCVAVPQIPVNLHG